MGLSGEPPIRCFLSYAQRDDLVMNFVGPFKESLCHLAYADRGRELEIFHDRASIGWGQRSANRIAESVRSAMVFLPIITRQFFDRDFCRHELFTFHNQTVVDQVPSLLLPVVLLGESFLTPRNPDPAVQIIVALQRRKLKNTWIEGPNSALWRKTMLDLANELVDHVEEAERTLLEPPERTPAPEQATAAVERFHDESTRMFEVASKVLTAFKEGGPVEELRANGLCLRDIARQYEQQTVLLDRLLREDLTGVRGLHDFTGPIDELVEGLEHLLDVVRPKEITDVPLRDAMHGFRDGIVAIRSAMIIVSSWAELPNPGQ